MGRGGRDGGFGGGYGGGGSGGKFDMSGKNLRKPKWNLSELPQFEKNFYREHINVQNRSAEEIASYRNKREITLVGRNVPKPVFTFEEAGFPGKIYESFGICAHFLLTVVATVSWKVQVWE